MTLDQAVQRARSLDFAAKEDWPLTPYDFQSVSREMGEILGVIDRAVAAVPENLRGEMARSLKQKIEGKVYKASVATRKRSA